MSPAGAALLLVVVLACAVAGVPRVPLRARVGAAVLAAAVLAATFVLSAHLRPDDPSPVAVRVGWLVTALVAALGGPPSALVLRLAGGRRASRQRAADGAADVLRGGATIGVLERLAVVGVLLAGLPDGIAVVVAVKALGRYPELRSPGASERFIIGTLVSLLWAAAAAGTGRLLLG